MGFFSFVWDLARNPLTRVALAVILALGSVWTYRNNVRQTAKNEVTQALTAKEIDKLQKTTNAQDRIRRDHLRGPDRLREHNDGYRRD